MLGKKFSRYFDFFFSQKIGCAISCKLSPCDISCKLSPCETICMKCQSPFSEKIKENIISLSSAEFAQKEVNI